MVMHKESDSRYTILRILAVSLLADLVIIYK